MDLLHHLLGFCIVGLFLQKYELCFADSLSMNSDVQWIADDDWTDCIGNGCGMVGSQSRSVRCYDFSLNIPTLHRRCDKSSKPDDQKKCFLVCDEHREQFQWMNGSWQSCQSSASLIRTQECFGGLPGSQNRTVSCVGVNNSSYVVENKVCIRLFGTPVTSQPCVAPCPVNCVTSLFGKWSQCSATCGSATQRRFRHVIRRDKHEGASCPPLYESRLCSDLPSCSSHHTLILGNWSDCTKTQIQFSTRKSKKKLVVPVINNMVGIRRREVTCLSTKSGKKVNDSTNFFLTETCIRNVDCAVTSWTNWGPCSASCGENGTQNRTRSITRLPQGPRSSTCPSLLEQKLCEASIDGIKPCFRYKWFAGDWTSCVSIHNKSCGGGLQSRHVFCVRQPAEDLGLRNTSQIVAALQPVDNNHCQSLDRLSEWQECDIPVPCKQKCDVSVWSEWSACALPLCPGDPRYVPLQKRSSRRMKGFKRRIRTVYNSFGSPEDCPPALEVIPCLNARCFFWKLDSISSCVPHAGECGVGLLTPHLSCRDMWGEVVEEESCFTYPEALGLAVETNCTVPCSSDCVLSEWSPWSPCPYTCRQARKPLGSQTRRRTVLAYPGPGGSSCPNENELTQRRLCNQHKCPIYFWSTSKWSECVANKSYGDRISNEIDGNWTLGETSIAYQQSALECERGYQTRKVVCQKKKSEDVHEKFCISASKPLSRRTCQPICDRDCILSAWSPWSDCRMECADWMNARGRLPMNEDDVLQRRTRYVIQQRNGGGDPCRRVITQTQPCTKELACSVYKWKIGKWSGCALASGVRSISNERNKCSGVRTRLIVCKQQTPTNTSTVSFEHCTESVGRAPYAAKLCTAHCTKSLEFGEWQQRYNCPLPRMPRMKMEKEIKKPFKSSNTISVEFGPWSSCFINDDDIKDENAECPASNEEIRGNSTSSLVSRQCGVGKRKRALRCVDRDTGYFYGVDSCDFRTFRWEECEIPCSRDCVMNKWMEWGECGNLLHGKPTPHPEPRCGKNVRVRYRYMIDESLNEGKSCPTLDSLTNVYQREACRSECSFYFWSDERNLKGCVPDDNTASCGKGMLVRSSENILCYRSYHWLGFPDDARIVDGDKCNFDERPHGSNVCRLPCSDECVFSEWSSWEPCKNGAGVNAASLGSCQGTKRRRFRKVLRQPSPQTDCSDQTDLQEVQNCVLNSNCYTYRAEWVEWSSCITGRDAECGSGFQRRRANCMRSDEAIVPISKCHDHDVVIPDPQTRSCRVPCPVDCRVSDWSIWSSCSVSCGKSRVRSRTRKVLRETSGLGRRCPQELVQKKPCCWVPCYEWKLKEWGECNLPMGICGEGVQMRKYECVQEDGIVIYSSSCQSKLALQDQFASSLLSRPCNVACPGTCQLTDWSSWGSCHGDCDENGNLIGAKKTRSRMFHAVGENQSKFLRCPPSEIQEVECTVDEAVCYTYTWKTSAFAGGIREVWCERDQDGMEVTFGCGESFKPSKIKMPSTCVQDCESVKRAICGEKGWCICPPPYKGEYGADSIVLVSCNVQSSPPEEKQTEDSSGTTLDEVVSSTSPFILISAPAKNDTTTRSLFNPFNEDGSLKPWAYAAMVGLLILLIFIIAVTYLLCSACRKIGSSNRKRRHKPSNGSNVGIVVTSTGGSSVYGTGGNGPPPYYVNAPKHTNNSNSRYTRTPGLIRTPSNRSDRSYRDRYDDEFN